MGLGGKEGPTLSRGITTVTHDPSAESWGDEGSHLSCHKQIRSLNLKLESLQQGACICYNHAITQNVPSDLALSSSLTLQKTKFTLAPLPCCSCCALCGQRLPSEPAGIDPRGVEPPHQRSTHRSAVYHAALLASWQWGDGKTSRGTEEPQPKSQWAFTGDMGTQNYTQKQNRVVEPAGMLTGGYNHVEERRKREERAGTGPQQENSPMQWFWAEPIIQTLPSLNHFGDVLLHDVNNFIHLGGIVEDMKQRTVLSVAGRAQGVPAGSWHHRPARLAERQRVSEDLLCPRAAVRGNLGRPAPHSYTPLMEEPADAPNSTESSQRHILLGIYFCTIGLGFWMHNRPALCTAEQHCTLVGQSERGGNSSRAAVKTKG
ncbi:hypothetical protein JZ751_024832, partial [Albula glossodonta]